MTDLREIELVNEEIRNEVIEEVVHHENGIIISFRGSAPDLFIGLNPDFLRSPGDDLKFKFVR